MTTTAPRAAAGNAAPTAQIDVVVSDRPDDIDDALRIVHDGFVEAGYMDPVPSGRRMHLSYLNPGTAFFVARIDEEPVGTCALIADGPFGLPSDRAFVEENDAMRAELVGRLHECGSLAVSRRHRRHTRRIMARVVAAMTRVAIAEFPHAPVPMAVAPENLRFYEALVGAQLVVGERPLYGAPAILMRTGGAPIAVHSARGESPIQRMMNLLITDPDPDWLTDRREAVPPPVEWLAPLLAECAGYDRLRDQQALLAALSDAGDGAQPVLDVRAA
ncbi:MAG TPA: hypothetical protein VL422_18855 [Miltoncostaea sp.]|nr:hypothetical protein [Miltoncostaea sp.]